MTRHEYTTRHVRSGHTPKRINIQKTYPKTKPILHPSVARVPPCRRHSPPARFRTRDEDEADDDGDDDDDDRVDDRDRSREGNGAWCARGMWARCVFYSRLPGRRRRGRRWSGDDARGRPGGGWMAAVTRGDDDGRDGTRCDATRGWRRANDARDGWMRSCVSEFVGTRGHSSRPRAGRVEWNASIAGSGRASLYPLRARSVGKRRTDARGRKGGGEARGVDKKIVLPFSSLRRRFVGVARRSRANECM